MNTFIQNNKTSNSPKTEHHFFGSSKKADSFIQPKLTINNPNDKYEQEADAMADKVMRMEQPGIQLMPLPISSLQRKCEHCEEEEKKMQRKEANGEELQADNNLENYVGSLSGAGQSLPDEVRNFYEPRFGYDFSNVKVHTDAVAAKSAQSINALAYTSGSNIVFNNGQFSPDTDSGKKLLGHELTHVVQQHKNLQAKKIQKLGANAGCTVAQRTQIHQGIFNARGWIRNALSKLNGEPNSSRVLRSLRRNFGPTYGVPENIPLIVSRIRAVNGALGTIPYSCDNGVNPVCQNNHCGYADFGSHRANICTNLTLQPGISDLFKAGCILHETFHATFTNFTPDEYSGWNGNSTSTPGYPGQGTEPLLNSDSYTTLIMDLS